MNTRLLLIALLTCATWSAHLGMSVHAHAYSEFVYEIPSTTPGDPCATCHGPLTKGDRNAFGKDVRATLPRGPDWVVLYALDSDEDGYTNGQELGDPMGLWVYNDPETPFLSAPGDASDTPCGNGQVDPVGDTQEACDGADFGGKTCADFGGTSTQPLACSDTCTLDTSACAEVPVEDMSPDMEQDSVADMPSPQDEPADVQESDMPSDAKSADVTPDVPVDDTPDDTPDDPPDTTPTPSTSQDGCGQVNTQGIPGGGAVMVAFVLLGILGGRRTRRQL